VREVDAVLDGEECDDRRAHPALPRVALSALEDAQVCELDAGDQPVFLVPLGAVHLVRPRSLGIVRGQREELSHGVDRHLARDLAGRVPSHSVGDDVKATFLDDRKIVLVVRALHADVGFAGGAPRSSRS
jgi:hypothetical protein